jgi:ribosomal-protein-alanine N-acetyltransferase
LLTHAGLEDVEALAHLEEQCFSHPWPAQSFREVLAPDSGYLALVLRARFAAGDRGRGILAYCVLQIVAGELQIHNLAVHPRNRGLGLGGWLLEYALGLGVRAGAEKAFLEVRRSNDQAMHLYQSLGFRTLGVRSGYYSHPKEDALLLVKGLP